MSAIRLEDTRLERNRSGFYEIRWTEEDQSGRARTRTYSCRTKDRALAEDIRQTWLTAAGHVQGMTLSHTVLELVDAYETGHIELNGVSDSQRWSLKPIKEILGRDTLADLTQTRIAQYRRSRARRVKDATIRRELGALRTVLAWGVSKRLLPLGVALPSIDLPPPSQAKETYLDAAEEARMWDLASALAMDPALCFRERRIGLFICLGLETAARSAAIEGLTWDRVDLIRGLVDYREAGRQVSKKRRVPVPVSNRLKPVLDDAFARRDPAQKHVLGHGGSTRKAFEHFRATHGFNITRHDLRRTWATLKAQRGVSMFDIAGVLGDTVETVTAHYAIHAPGHLRSAVNA